LFSLIAGINYCFGLYDRKGKYNLMFMCPNGGSMSTESSELSGEEGFHGSYNRRENMEISRAFKYVLMIDHKFTAAFRT